LIQTEKQRLRIKSAGVAPETLQGPGAMHARRWWVYDSKAAAKQRGAAPRRQSGAQCSRTAGSEGSSHATSASHDGHNGTCKAADSQQSCQ
jgi:hypothetical protein